MVHVGRVEEALHSARIRAAIGMSADPIHRGYLHCEVAQSLWPHLQLIKNHEHPFIIVE